MKTGFEPITFVWNKRQYTIRADQVLPVLAAVENHLTLAELHRAQDRQGVPLAKLALAFSEMLKFCGAEDASADDVYLAMFTAGDQQKTIAEAVTLLISMMVPPAALAEDLGLGNSKAVSAAVATGSSRRPTKSRSRRDGSAVPSSGSSDR